MHPDGRVVAVDQEGGARSWPMPDADEPPLHTLPYDELLTKLRGVTNLRVVEDESQDTGYRLTLDGFAGWRETPKW
jgi:hypothetical protein